MTTEIAASAAEMTTEEAIHALARWCAGKLNFNALDQMLEGDGCTVDDVMVDVAAEKLYERLGSEDTELHALLELLSHDKRAQLSGMREAVRIVVKVYAEYGQRLSGRMAVNAYLANAVQQHQEMPALPVAASR